MYDVFSFVQDKCPFFEKKSWSYIFEGYAVTAVLQIFQARLFKQKTQVISFNSVANFEASLI